jgi:hypothetical protein
LRVPRVNPGARTTRDNRSGVARALTAAVALLLAGVGSGTARGASSFDPALRFRMLPTEHFVIYYHQGEDALGRRLASIAEETWRALQQPLGVAPPRRTHVVLADQTELANGYATPVPYNTIVIYAAWPAGTDFIGDLDDWLRLAFTHEFTHIVHLDRSEGWARVVRNVFGRTLFAFPNVFLPQWQIEGLATFEESAITGGGRLHAGDFGAIVGEAARLRRLEPLDRINGGLTDWPSGLAPYAYGLGFHQYLAARFGAETLATLAAATARRVPYTASRVFERVYGERLGDLWRDYEASVASRAGAEAPAGTDQRPGHAEVQRITHHGFAVSGPRFDRFHGTDIVYAARTPHAFPALNRVALHGSVPRRVATRYFGSTTAIGRDALYFDQLELRRNVGLYSDLYELTRSTGRVRRMTSNARLLDPDLSPDERTIVCVQDRTGGRDLVLVRRKPHVTQGGPQPFRTGSLRRPVSAGVEAGSPDEPAIETLLSEPETQFNAPRWSPDGQRIAVERHRVGSLSEIVIVDVASRAVRIVASQPRTRIVTPAWRIDGRAIVAAVAPENQPFNLFEFGVDDESSRQLTDTAGGAIWPDVSADGTTIAFVGYTVDGFDVFTTPYPAAPAPTSARSSARPTPPAVPGCDSSALFPTIAQPARASAAYSPLKTLEPTSWSPVVEGDSSQLRAGAAIAGNDVLGYHFYGASATWLLSGPTDGPRPGSANPDWQISYAYDRWRPTFFVAASSATSFFAGPATESGTPTPATLRAHELQAGVVAPVRHARVSHTALLGVLRASNDYTLPDRTFSRNRTAVRAAWATSTAHTYGFSISPEHGVTGGATIEVVRRALGSFADATTITGDLRAYLPSFDPHHVIAIRLAGGGSTGDPTIGRTFLLGGASPNPSVVSFGSGAIRLLRGFGPNTFAGSRVALANADYRFPIARPQRGVGTWPFFVHTIHAATFADAGHAWTRTFRAAAIKTSIGAELSADVIAGYYFPFTMAAGAAWGRDGSGAVRGGRMIYARVGRSF